MLDLIPNLGAVVGLLLGLASAALLHWVFPSLADATLLYGALIAIGFIAGMVVGNRFNKEK